MIKGKPSYPFDTVALAIAFSPRLEQLIAETKRLTGIFHARAIFIHAGKKTSDKQRQLTTLLSNYGFNDTNSKIVWELGNPVDAILAVCKREVVDLLIIGALEKENVLKYYMGSISREISRKAKCCVLMLTRPSVQPRPFRKIIANGHEHAKTLNTLNTALYFAKQDDASEITVVDEVDIPALSMSMAEDSTEPEGNQIRNEFISDEHSRMTGLLNQISPGSINIHHKIISGRSGHTISKFAAQQAADLLVVNSPDHSLSIFDRIFTHDLEYMLADMPCNMLIVHTRNVE
ncbi:MAG TPA: universal stress protein [Bacteroidia bacterium]|nr:universal stress protein [Bacteroidia bacterium]